ncbi:3,4-dihydroxy-2-butanone-4-phosphate synthase [Hyperthermus butylicus]|uniref:3,4-dihydroxy-2-butanone 4-phosphate synthase n=1 Tax=Hyperthermus butylicus (strain DSM 5456 / JCM 9403 / PLM1-5) TaxID=415426 RepID=A2BKA7_HYPBU|nr:3,4-dihydroxy-2-butanone-4-phosphate synthase [Hyperthermus butylicus]ABM80418.1 3,4-dihydroxy-2-butanone 4-phosphate synthase [Hyperthermus butylicus DSM 5456]
MGELDKAIEAMRKGIPVLIHDDYGREDEVDYVIHASYVTVDKIYEMRTLAGGLICYAMPLPAGEMLGLRYIADILAGIEPLGRLAERTLGYGDKPAFSLWVNHLKARTGIRDRDRALTIRELDRVVNLIYSGRVEEARKLFYESFMAPGHVPILLGRRLGERRGHTELSLHLAMLAGMTPSTVIVEMLDRGEALSVEEARRVSREKGYPLVEGSEIIAEVERRGEDMYCRYNLCKNRHG